MSALTMRPIPIQVLPSWAGITVLGAQNQVTKRSLDLSVARVAVDVTVDVAKNAAMTVPAVRERRLAKPRTSSADPRENAEPLALRQLRRVLEILKDVDGCSVLEIGPGDHLGLGLALLAAGASEYASVDRFPGPYSNEYAKRWYNAVHSAWPASFPDLPWPPDLDPQNFPECSERVHIHRESFETMPMSRRFDIVLSFNVAEHVRDIEQFAAQTGAALSGTGSGIHRIDFGPHARWRRYDDPLTFLRVPERVWHIMSSSRGLPNRRRLHEFQAAFASAGLESEVIESTCLRTPPDRSGLASRFHAMPLGSLRVLDALVVCRKSDGEGRS